MSQVGDGILDAARAVFGARGYASSTVKSIAAAAGVTPGIVTSLYNNKEQLFAAAMRLPFDPVQAIPRLIAPGLDGMGDRLVRMSLTLMDDPAVRGDATSLMKKGARAAGAATMAGAAAGASSAAGGGADSRSTEAQVRALIEYVQSAYVDPLASVLGVPDARMRAALITASLGGMIGARYVLKLEPLASASTEEVAALFAPGIQRLLDPTRPVTG
jgi:AcrR family transcriptional regulator